MGKHFCTFVTLDIVTRAANCWLLSCMNTLNMSARHRIVLDDVISSAEQYDIHSVNVLTQILWYHNAYSEFTFASDSTNTDKSFWFPKSWFLPVKTWILKTEVLNIFTLEDVFSKLHFQWTKPQFTCIQKVKMRKGIFKKYLCVCVCVNRASVSLPHLHTEIHFLALNIRNFLCQNTTVF